MISTPTLDDLLVAELKELLSFTAEGAVPVTKVLDLNTYRNYFGHRKDLEWYAPVANSHEDVPGKIAVPNCKWPFDLRRGLGSNR